MYHFVSERTAELRLSDNVLISSHTTQYLKTFQLDAVRFLYERLSKQEFCIFNDESGLGKCATISALLNGLGASKKTLIVLQNDDQLLAGWQFHLGVLTDLPVCVIKDVNDSTQSPHNVYLSKWSVLRSIGDLSKLNFDYIIVDHRGYTLNNNFCTSMLLKQYERKVNILISSVDLTSDVKLLYNVLRMGGCLEHQYKSFRNFNLKFHLPDVKEVLSKRVDLEEYYKQRGVLGEYIKDFRLRRYRHQFESYLPLVTPEQYKINLSLWMAENNSHVTISGSTEAPSTGSTDEIFDCLLSLKHERERERDRAAQHQEAERTSLSEYSDDALAMEPLVFEMSESEAGEEVADEAAKASTDDVVMLSSDDCEIVTPPITPPPSSPIIAKPKRKHTRHVQAQEPVELSDSETEERPTTSKITVRKLTVQIPRYRSHQLEKGIPRAANPHNPLKNMPKPATVAPKAPPEHLRTPDPVQPSGRKANKTSEQPTPEPQTPQEERPSPSTPKTEPKSKRAQEKSSSNAVPRRETRGMQRLTRSAESRTYSKYRTSNLSLTSPKRKRNTEANQTPRTSKIKKELTLNQENADTNKKTEATPKKKRGRPFKQTTESSSSSGNANEDKPKRPRGRPSGSKNVSNSSTSKPSKSRSPSTAPAATQELLISGSTLSNCSYMQCGQKLPDNLVEIGSLELAQFRVPLAPPATPLMLPLPQNFFSDSELAFVPNSNQKSEIVMVNSSHDESSEHSVKQSQSRRTKALKRKRSAPPKEQQQPSTSSFGELLAKQRATANKSPDIFSNCSDLSQLTLAQPAPFEGFKIFGSEVKQLQQQHSNAQPVKVNKKKRERSCLDILEKMFEPIRTEANEPGVQLLPQLPSPNHQLTSMLDDDIFEITNNGEFGSRLRLTATGHVSPVLQQQRNKITNYLISSGATPEDASLRSQTSQALRKSPKANKSTQSTKLTRWFGTTAAATAGGESQSVPSTPVAPPEKAASARAARSGGAGKRKRLDLFK